MNLSSSLIQQDSLLTTKLYIPRVRHTLVPRPRLTAQLDQSLEIALTIISAPAGFGKTTLLGEWVADLRLKDEKIANRKSKIHQPRVAWLSLDEGANDPVHFLSHFIAALQTIQGGIGEATMATLRDSPTRPPHDETVLTSLINEIAIIPENFVLILDDYHLINTQRTHDALTFLLDHLPPQMHLMIASRTDPPLPLARLRAQGELMELRTADLRFTPDEVATFLNQVMGLDLSATHIATLEARTEGWIAGLQLAALSMQNRQDISSFIVTFTGSHRYILDYLAEEVLQRQPEQVQTFLLQTSILNRLTGALCDMVTGQTNSAAVLERLEQANLFIIPLDDERCWYRYHHLFADFLRSHLQRQVGAQGLAALHRRAADWYEQNGLMAEAVSHALATADVERAARLIEQSGRTLLSRSEMASLLSWVEALPEEIIRARPRLSLFQAWALVLTGQLDAVEARLSDFIFPTSDLGLEKAGQSKTPWTSLRSQDRQSLHSPGRTAPGKSEIEGEMTAIRATVAYFRRDIPQAIALYRQALEDLPQENLFLRGAVAMSLATAYNLQGDIDGAKWAFTRAGEISEANNDVHTTLVASWNLAQLHVEQGHLFRAAECYRRALQLADQKAEQGTQLLITGRIHVGLGEVLYQWNDLEGAIHHLLAGIRWGEQAERATALMSSYLALARVKYAQEDLDGAFEAIGKAEVVWEKSDLPSWSIRLAACQVELQIRQGDLEAAARWMNKSQLSQSSLRVDDSAGYPESLDQIKQLTQVRLLIAQNKPDEALILLASLLQKAEEAKRTGRVIEILELQALTIQAQGDADRAVTTLERALSLAEPEGYIRLFVDEGPPMVELLRRVASRGIASGYTSKLLQAFPPGKHDSTSSHRSPNAISSLLDPLSDRELEILHLIATGLSNRQISEELFLTVGTVKWHINNLYSKLDVRSRTQAVARARELGLL